MNSVEQQAADLILEKGVRVKVPAPFFIPFRKTVSLIIRQPKGGTLLEVARICLKSGFNLDTLKDGEINAVHSLVEKHMKALVRIIAVLFLNSKWKIRLFSRMFSRYLLWKLTARKMAEVALLAMAFGGYQDFTTTIRLIGATRITAPKGLSPEERGS